MGMAAILVSDQDNLNKFSFPHPKESPYEIWVQFVWKCWQTDGRQSHWYTNSSPLSLRLRWANKCHIPSKNLNFFYIQQDKGQTTL